MATQTETPPLPHWDLSNVFPGLESDEFQLAVDKIKTDLKAMDSYLVEAEIGKDNPIPDDAAMLADRSDISEEITRLAAHLDLVETLLAEDGARGKQIDFALQEAFREVNTIGAKARDLTVGRAVIEMKSELERMREQAANVE